MGKVQQSVSVIGRLDKRSSGGWVFSSCIKPRGVSVRINKPNTELGYLIEFKSRKMFVGWLNDAANEREMGVGEIEVSDMVEIIRAG